MAAKPRRTMKQIQASARIRKEAADERRRWKARMGAAVKAAGHRPTSVTFGTVQVASTGGGTRKMFTVTGVWPGYGPSRPIIRKSVSQAKVKEIGARWSAGKAAKKSTSSASASAKANPSRKSSRRR